MKKKSPQGLTDRLQLVGVVVRLLSFAVAMASYAAVASRTHRDRYSLAMLAVLLACIILLYYLSFNKCLSIRMGFFSGVRGHGIAFSAMALASVLLLAICVLDVWAVLHGNGDRGATIYFSHGTVWKFDPPSDVRLSSVICGDNYVVGMMGGKEFLFINPQESASANEAAKSVDGPELIVDDVAYNVAFDNPQDGSGGFMAVSRDMEVFVKGRGEWSMEEVRCLLDAIVLRSTIEVPESELYRYDQ